MFDNNFGKVLAAEGMTTILCLPFGPCHDPGLAPGGRIVVQILVCVRAPTAHCPLQGANVAVAAVWHVLSSHKH